MIRSRGLIWLSLLATLAACGSAQDETLAPAKSGKALATKDKIIAMSGKTIGTPMAERVAVLGLLNKRNGQTRDVELKPGQAIRFDKVVIRLRACEKTAPWENPPEEGAFVQLLVNERPPGRLRPKDGVMFFGLAVQGKSRSQCCRAPDLRCVGQGLQDALPRRRGTCREEIF